jgi:hypothetical protein
MRSLVLAVLAESAQATISCWDTPLLNDTVITTAEPHSPDPWVPSTTAAECKLACCGADLCVAWSFGARNGGCTLYTERGVLGRAPGSHIVTAFRAMSVPPDQSWPFSWDTVPMFTHSSNASGLYSPTALTNLTASFPVVGLDWEVNFTASRSHHLRQNTVAQAQAIVAAAPASKVLVYQQGFLALNFSDAEAAAMSDRANDDWWIHNQDGSIFTWDVGDCSYGVHCARVMNSSVAEMRKWYVDKVALPTLAMDGVAGLFVDNSMQLGMPPPSQGAPWQSLDLQRAAAQLHREIGQAMLAQHPGKRTLLSVQQILFTDNQPPPTPSPCAAHPSPCWFVLSGLCPSRELTVYYVDAVSRTKAWVVSCEMCGLNICAQEPAMQNMTCAELDALADTIPFDCSMLPSPPQPGPQVLLTEQELLAYWRDIPWMRYYDGVEPEQATITAASPGDCVAFVRNMQLEALAGVPVVAGTGRVLGEQAFRKSLAMFLMGAERHSRFGMMNGYVCTEPGVPPPPGLPANQWWSDTSCTWLWRPEFEWRLGAPHSWASWDGGFRFERTFEHLNVSLDCATGSANFTWH